MARKRNAAPAARKSSDKKPPAVKPPQGVSPRAGGSRFHIFNSGLEVWLYDEASREEIRASGGMDFRSDGAERTFDQLTREGLVVGYSLYQDDELDVEVLVGPPLTGIAERAYVGGVVTNTPENLVRWIQNPPAIDPMTAMPNVGVTADEARDIAAYLYSH